MKTSRALTGSLLAGLLLLAGCGGHQQPGGSAAGASGSASSGPSSSTGRATKHHASATSSTSTSSTSTGRSTPPASTAPSTQPTGTAAAQMPSGTAVPAGFKPYSVTYVSSSTGYILGAAPCSHAPCTSLVRTTDGGASWHGVPAPVVISTGGSGGPYVARPDAVRDVRFASPTDGWAFGGALYATHDGAAHWHKISLPGSVLDLETGGTTAYAVVASCDSSGRSCQNEHLYATPVGRDAWVRIPAATGTGTVTGSGGELSIAGGHAMALLGTKLFVRTSTGWTPSTPCTSKVSGGAVDSISASASGSALFALCPAGAGLGHLYVDVYRSTDGGQQWSRRAHGVNTTDAAHSLTAASPTTLALATSSIDLRGALSVSWDGGASWHNAVAPDLSQGWRYVGARGATSLVALPGKPTGSIYSSSDGGHSWHAQRVG